MTRKSKKVQKKKSVKAPIKRDPLLENEFETVIEFDCPVRGRVKQKVKVKKYKTSSTEPMTNIVTASDTISELEEDDSGFSIYTPSEEEGE